MEKIILKIIVSIINFKMVSVSSVFAKAKQQKLKEKELQQREANRIQKEVDGLTIVFNRNWFLNDYDIDELLWDIEQDIFDELYKNKHLYPLYVRQALHRVAGEPLLNVDFLTEKIYTDMTDEIMFDLQDSIEEQRKKLIEQKWETYKQTIPSRPLSHQDEEYDNLYSCLQQRKKQLAEEENRSTPGGRYVPPSQRNNAPKPKSELYNRILSEIQKMEKQIEAIKAEITKIDNEWISAKRKIFDEENEYMLYV